MGRPPYQPRPLQSLETEPFADSEEAWMWYSYCQLARLAGCRPRADMGGVARPCDPDDIHRAAMALAQRGILLPSHVRTLAEVGALLAGSAVSVSLPALQNQVWIEALKRLEPALRAKGIVA